MDLVTRLLGALADQDSPWKEDNRHPDLEQLSDDEFCLLHAAAVRVGGQAAEELRQRSRMVLYRAAERVPRYSPASCRALFEAYVEASAYPACDRPLLHPLLGVLERCAGPLPDLAEPARALVGNWLAGDTTSEPYTLLELAGLGGAETVASVVTGLHQDAGPIVGDEIALLAARGAGLLALPSPDERAAEPSFAAFSRRALEAAADRTDAIAAGRLPYLADKAFTDGEVDTLGRALAVALARDEPWLPGLFDRLLPGVTLAPGTARTLPSQALLYEIVRAAQDAPTPELVSALRTVRGTVRHRGVPKVLDRMLKKVDAALAERTEVALRLPRLGFDVDGVLRRPAGDYTAVVTVTDAAVLTWERDGRTLSGTPAPVRRDHAALVKELRGLVKRVNAHLATLVRALEGGFTVETAVHPYRWWREELAGHPLARTLVRRLIWEVEAAPGRWATVLPETAEQLPDAPDDARVRLWHPLRGAPEEVRAWREVLVDARLRQPFKQAFREIYLLTPAEEETRDYSNRFAAHLVHYRRMFALFRARGWKSALLGPWDIGDGDDDAERTLAAGAWRVRFRHYWAEGMGPEHLELASTDQVRFDRRADGGWRETPLVEVPAMVFSEAMRDVDLFVGVASIAADPEWTDHGEARRYWERSALTELTQSAESRRDALARILPRLKIADRCALEDRYLTVRGELRTYRIHLGSANILMEPDDSYLCIVPARRRKGQDTLLPFDDERLALILSKALLLADDTAITDPDIVRQLRRG